MIDTIRFKCMVVVVVALSLFANCMPAAYGADPDIVAHDAYVEQLDAISRAAPKNDPSVYYLYEDICGDRVQEMLCVWSQGSGSGSRLQVFRYENGRARCLLTEGIYGDYRYDFYRQTSSFALYRSGHGGQSIAWYSLSGNMYKKRAEKGRQASGGSWKYSVVSSSSEYDRVVHELAKGKKIQDPGHSEWPRCQ